MTLLMNDAGVSGVSRAGGMGWSYLPGDLRLLVQVLDSVVNLSNGPGPFEAWALCTCVPPARRSTEAPVP